MRLGYEVLFTTHHKPLGQLHAARATNAYEKKLRQLIRVDLIIVDDFGLHPMRSPQEADFHDLVNERHERAATVITSNLHFDEWGAATLDRLRDGAYRIVLDGETRRKPRPPPESPPAESTGAPRKPNLVPARKSAQAADK